MLFFFWRLYFDVISLHFFLIITFLFQLTFLLRTRYFPFDYFLWLWGTLALHFRNSSSPSFISFASYSKFSLRSDLSWLDNINKLILIDFLWFAVLTAMFCFKIFYEIQASIFKIFNRLPRILCTFIALPFDEIIRLI